MVQAAQNRHGTHAASQHRARRAPLRGSGHPLSQALMRPGAVEVRDVLLEDTSQVGLAQDEHMVEARAPHAPQEPLARGVLPGRAIRRAQLLDAGGRRDAGEGWPVLAVVVADEVVLAVWLIRSSTPACKLIAAKRIPRCEGGNDASTRRAAAGLHWGRTTPSCPCFAIHNWKERP